MKKYKLLIISLVLSLVFFVSFSFFCRNNPAFLMDDVSDLCKEFYSSGFLHACFLMFGFLSFGFVGDQIFSLFKPKKNDPT